MIFLIGCQSNPQVQYETRYVTPPEVYLEKCPREFSNNVKEIILGLDRTIRCYESKQDSLKVWYQNKQEDID